ncbi:hypothetical protein NDU88_004602 [Pleurodeles waltl]|uniref:RNase H type-1 domain-containing protein n=1 Tax=Pleurodeles waltl TaxID=8319 RepID=A0AAV7QCS5_PLEWA|nr:hypothetical protein NDU88_004602 [Pleurodeles waltl]
MGGAAGAVAWHEGESDPSLEEGELVNSGSETKWWECGKGQGDANPVPRSLQVEKQLMGRPGGRKKERARVEARTVQERPPLLSPGRTFCRRLAQALSGQVLPHHHVRLKVGVREDLRMWATFLESFNGIPLRVWRDCEWDVQLFSDAAESSGFGLYWEGRWCAEEWPSEWKNGGHSTAFLELFPLIVAVCLWGSELWHSRVLFHVDNLAVVQMVNRQSAREARVLQLMHIFVLQCLRNEIFFRARHVPGVNNDIADALSRSQWERSMD